jgi:hypothetical protein
MSEGVECIESRLSSDECRLYSILNSRVTNSKSGVEMLVPLPAYFTGLPPAIRGAMSEATAPVQMGVFNAIERVWITVDNVLYLWDYNRGGKDSGAPLLSHLSLSLIPFPISPCKSLSAPKPCSKPSITHFIEIVSYNAPPLRVSLIIRSSSKVSCTTSRNK